MIASLLVWRLAWYILWHLPCYVFYMYQASVCVEDRGRDYDHLDCAMARVSTPGCFFALTPMLLLFLLQLFSTFRQFLEAVIKDDYDFEIVQHFTSYRLILTEQFLDYYRQYSKLLLGRREVVELLPVIADAVVDELQNRALGNHQLGVPRSTLDHVSDQLRMHPKLSNIKAYLMVSFM